MQFSFRKRELKREKPFKRSLFSGAYILTFSPLQKRSSTPILKKLGSKTKYSVLSIFLPLPPPGYQGPGTQMLDRGT